MTAADIEERNLRKRERCVSDWQNTAICLCPMRYYFYEREVIMKKLKISSVLLIAALLAGVLAGCGDSSEEASSLETVADDDTLTVGVALDITAIDPIHGYDHDSDMVLTSIAEGLFYFDENNEVQPLIAESYEQTDNLTYIYKIREDVNFSDGSKLTADDVVFSLERHRDLSNPSELAWMFDKVDTIEKTGDYEVTVQLKSPDPTWQDTLATSAGLIISKAYWEEHQNDFGTAKGGIVASGPYVLSDWKPGVQIELSENENYWNKDSSLDFKKIIFKYIADTSVLKSSVQSGQVDITADLTADECKELKDSGSANIQVVRSFYCNFLSFNTSKAPFNDKNVRKAIAYAVDKTSISDNLYKGEYGAAANGLLFDDTIINVEHESWDRYFDDVEKYDYDLEKAKDYLKKSSVPDGFDATLIYNINNSADEIAALAIQENLAELNIHITLEGITRSEINTQRYGGTEARTYDLMFTGWLSDYPDVTGTIVPLFLSENNGAGGSNWFEYQNSAYDSLIADQNSASDTKERAEILQSALDIIVDDLPALPVVYPYSVFAVSDRVDYQFSPSYLYNVFLKDAKKKG